MIPTTLQKISDGVKDGTIHGWHTSKLVRYGGALYAIATVVDPNDPNNPNKNNGVLYRRDKDGTWSEACRLAFQPYVLMVDPKGRFWILGRASEDTCEMYRSGPNADVSRWEQKYVVRSTHPGAAISPEGNILFMWAEAHGGPQLVSTAFYDAASDTWYTRQIGGIPPIENRYGYEAIFLRGKSVLLVMQSYNAFAADGKSDGGAGVWRYVRVARCEDLTKSQWEHKLIAGEPWGVTYLFDAYQADDGKTYLTYATKGGQTKEDLDKGSHGYLATIGKGLDVDIKPVDYPSGKTKFLVDSAGRWHLMGIRNNELHLWDLDVSSGLALSNERRLANADANNFAGYVIHTDRPQRFGGESDKENFYLLGTGQPETGDPKDRSKVPLWFLSFPIPKN
ncbi:MAG: hypothetical protein WC869_09435 [Phycisphaerae bacterium]